MNSERARFMHGANMGAQLGPTGPMLAPWTLLSGNIPMLLDIIGTTTHFVSNQICPFGFKCVHPCEKVIGMFFQHRIWSRLLDINRLCLVCIKRSTEEVKKCQISKRGYQQGPSVETLKKAPCQFCDDKFGHRIMEAVGFFDYEMLNFTQITFNFTNRWSKGVV